MDTHPADHNAVNLAVNDITGLVTPQYRITNATNSVNVGTGAWSGIAISGAETHSGSVITISGNGLKVSKAGLYQADLMIQSGNGSTNTTVTIGVGKAGDAGPTGFNRASTYTGGAGISNTGTWLIRLSVNDVLMGFVTHNSSGTLPFSTRRLSLRYIAP